MAQQSLTSYQRKLRRELKHLLWLQQNLPQSTQLRRCRRRILELRTAIAVTTGCAVGI